MKYYLSTQHHEYSKQPKCLGFKIGKPIQTVELISIGIISEGESIFKKSRSVGISEIIKKTEREYYAISKDFDIDAAWNDWQWEKISDKQIKISKAKARRKGGFTQNIGYPKGSYWLRLNVLGHIFLELCTKNDNEYVGYPYTLGLLKKLINKYGKTNKQIAEEVKKFVFNGYEFSDISMFDNKRNNLDFYNYNSDYDWVVFSQLFGSNLPKGFPKYCISLKQELSSKIKELLPKGRRTSEDELDTIIKEYPNYPKQPKEYNILSKAKWNKELHKFINTLNG